MANEKNELNCVNWGEVFGFTRVFRSFRLARNVSALALGLAAIALVCVTGWLMDDVAGWAGQSVMKGEIRNFSRQNGETFFNAKKAWNKRRPVEVAALRGQVMRQRRSLARFIDEVGNRGIANQHFRKALIATVVEQNNAADKEKKYKAPDDEALLQAARDDWSGELELATKDAKALIARIEGVIRDARDQAAGEVRKVSKDKRSQAEDDLDQYYVESLRALTKTRMDFAEKAEEIRGRKIFRSFVAYEADALKGAAVALLSGNVTGGLTRYLADDGKAAARTADAGADDGFIAKMLSAAVGAAWLFSEHWLFATVLLLVTLAIWAFFGGAIHRIAAVQAARDEKISCFQAMRFARDKFASFFFAPLMPLAIIGFLGLLMMAGGLLVNIPAVGPLIVGVLFFLALVLGLAIAFLLVGLLGGAGLMFPTIAVEGSDAFDAMSRSFSYVFSRPWRAALYAAAAVVHGTICYMFIRVFAFLALKATHFFVSGAVWTGGQTLPGVGDPDKMDVLWTAPTLKTLHTCNWDAMSGWETAAAIVMMFWIYAIIGLVASFVLTYMAGATTSIYLLLRRKVDATDYDDVYVEEDEENEEEDKTDFTAAAVAEPAEVDAADATDQPPAEDQPSETAPADDEEKSEKDEKDEKGEKKKED